MNNKLMGTVLFAMLLGATSAYAADGKVTISSPANGATVSSSDKIKLTYEVVPGPDGDHVHLNVDGKRIDLLRELKGTATIDALPPGKHKICLAVNTRGHVPTGVEGCVDVTSK
ncbi:MAG: hypothetical protein V4443_11220 [Pseudomonadota bacterium]